MGGENALARFKLDYRMLVQPGKNIQLHPDGRDDNVIHEAQFPGSSLVSPTVRKVRHRLLVPSTTLPLVDRMFAESRIESHFDSDYVYIYKESCEESKLFLSAAPVRARVQGRVRHVTPAMLSVVSRPDVLPFDQYLPYRSLRIRSGISKSERESLRRAGFVRTEIELTRFEREHGSSVLDLTFRMSVAFYRYYWGEFLRVLPLPRLPEPGEHPNQGLILGIGDAWWTDADRTPSGALQAFKAPNLWNSLDSLNTIMQPTGKQRVLIRGEPGSGKEVYSKAIHFGSVRPKDDEEGLYARAVAAMGKDDLRGLLYGRYVDGVLLPGMIRKAEGGTLFLDEFDKLDDPSSYADLLRVLEAGEYVPEGGPGVEDVGDVGWIFAGAFTGKGKSKSETDLPDDFWSRLSAQIEIDNPLRYWPREIGNSWISYAGAVFIYFYLRAAMDFAGGFRPFLEKERKGKKDKRTIRARYAQLLCSGLGEPSLDMGSHLAELLSKFQNGIQDGVYCRQVFDERQVAERKMSRWTAAAGARPDYSEVTEIEGCAAEWAYDSVRSIMQAAQASFAHMRFLAMTTDVWPAGHQEDELRRIFGEGADRAIEVVKQARPGREVAQTPE